MQKLVFVHLSDIHFMGRSGTSVHDLDADVRNELVRDAAKLTKDLGGATGVLVTGDIAFSGKRAEYDRATSWLLEFCREIGCPEESVSVVPGNHDVDRGTANGKVTKTFHQSIRSKSGPAIDTELREILSDAQSADALLAPLTEYNKFAARFQCSLSAERPYWERDLVLVCGTIVRLRGICSALVSDEGDKRCNIVLGTAQASVPRIDGVEYLTLCHHPPDWLQDQDAVENHLDSKVRIQLFGHKHSPRVQAINQTLRITAGAMHPERESGDWEPVYNIIEIERRDDQCIGVRVFQRRWHKTDSCFVADLDSTEMPYREYLWPGCPRLVQNKKRAADATELAEAGPAVPGVVAVNTTTKDNEAMSPSNHERRLTYRFLTLPFRLQIAIAQSLNVLTDKDLALGDEALFQEVFRRAVDRGLLGELWEETEKRHTDPATFNPFMNSM